MAAPSVVEFSPLRTRNLKKKDYIYLDGHFWKEVFTSEKIYKIFSSKSSQQKVTVSKDKYQVVGLHADYYVSLLCSNGELKEDLKLQDSAHISKIVNGLARVAVVYASIISIMGQEGVRKITVVEATE